ncbi:MAG TPA: hypothetical protein VK487_10775 [Candidatus Bathyarchaeia archaeon]|nr:hypothetical protein [Candidatus Bathyarchaeia archaeon]
MSIGTRTQEKWFADYWGFSDAYYSNGLVRMENYGLSLLVLVFIIQIGTIAFAAHPCSTVDSNEFCSSARLASVP